MRMGLKHALAVLDYCTVGACQNERLEIHPTHSSWAFCAGRHNGWSLRAGYYRPRKPQVPRLPRHGRSYATKQQPASVRPRNPAGAIHCEVVIISEMVAPSRR
jgi:hypothetical protein